MRAALKLDARELAVAFAQAGVRKPFDAGQAGPLPALRRRHHRRSASGDLAKAVELAEQGEKYDAEHNGGQPGRRVRAEEGAAVREDEGRGPGGRGVRRARSPSTPTRGSSTRPRPRRCCGSRTAPKALYFAEKGLAKAKEARQPRPGRPLPGTARRREAGVGNGRPTTSWECGRLGRR